MNITLRITLFFSFAVFIYAILDELNVFYYMSVLWRIPNDLVKNYCSKPLVDFHGNRIVVPFDNRNLNKSLKSILSQTVRPHELAVHVPLTHHSELVENVAKLYPQTHHFDKLLFPVLLRERNSDTYVLLLNNDRVLDPDFMERLIDHAEKYDTSTSHVLYTGDNQIWQKFNPKTQETNREWDALFVNINNINPHLSIGTHDNLIDLIMS